MKAQSSVEKPKDLKSDKSYTDNVMLKQRHSSNTNTVHAHKSTLLQSKKNKFVTIALFALLSIGVVVYLKAGLPISFAPCFIRQHTGINCPGCGGTRAIHSLLQFNIADAMYFNLLLVLSVFYLGLAFCVNIYKVYKHNQFIQIRSSHCIVFTAFVIIFLIMRNTTIYAWY